MEELDLLAEKIRCHSPYNYNVDNPVYFIDTDEVALDDLDCEQLTTILNLCADLKTKEQAKAKGYWKVNEVFASGNVHTNDYGTMVGFAADGNVVVNNI
jgi:hypothetical protein